MRHVLPLEYEPAWIRDFGVVGGSTELGKVESCDPIWLPLDDRHQAGCRRYRWMRPWWPRFAG